MSLSHRSAYRLARFMTDVNFMFARQDRRLVFENLKTIFPGFEDSEIRAIRRKMSRNFAKYLVDFFRFPCLDDAFMKSHVTIENLSYVDEALGRGKGVILVSAHVGNWELGGAAMAARGYRMSAVALDHADKRVNEFFVNRRQQRGISVISLGKAARQCLGVLRKGGILALIGDRDFSPQANGVVTDFFGKPTRFPQGPASLHVTTGAALIPGFMLRNPDDTFTLRFERPVECPLTGNRARDVETVIRAYARIFERTIRRHPDQWYMFRRFWEA